MSSNKGLNNREEKSKVMNERQIILTVGFGALGYFAAGNVVGGIVGAVIGYLIGSRGS